MISDTTPEVAALVLKLRREQTDGQRMSHSFEMSELVRSLELGVLRDQYPAANEEEILYRLALKRYGADLADRAFGRLAARA